MKQILTAALAALLSLSAGAATLSPIQLLNPTGSTAGQAIVSTGAATPPAWGGPSATVLTGIVPVAHGGTNCAAAGGTCLDNISGFSTTGFVYRNSANSYVIITPPIIQGVGGTGLSNLAAHQLVVGGSGNAMTALGVGTSGQVLTSGGAAADPVFSSTINSVSVGATTPSTGKFTTLSTTAMSRVKASSTNAQTIANNTFVTITTWTASQNQGSNFVASTGVYTAPVAGDYDVRAALRGASLAPASTSQFIVAVLVNGTEVKQGGAMQPATAAVPQASVSTIVTCNAGDTITIQVFQNTGATVTLDANPTANWIVISQLP